MLKFQPWNKRTVKCKNPVGIFDISFHFSLILIRDIPESILEGSSGEGRCVVLEWKQPIMSWGISEKEASTLTKG